MANYQRVVKHIKDTNIISGVLYSDCIYIISEEMEEFYPKTLNIYMYFPKFRERHDEWGAISYSNAKFRKGVTTSNADFLGLFVRGGVVRQKNFKEGADGFKSEKNIEPRGGITDVTIIDGEVYASASGGEIYKRIRNDKWQEIAHSVTGRFFSDERFTYGFLCISGFSADEIYAGGEKGILWLCDNGNWRPLDLPTNHDIAQIICASDGFVYLNCERYILKGRKDKWEKITVPKKLHWEFSIYKIAWFKGELYALPMAASAQGMAVYRDEKLQAVEVGSWSINPKKIVNDNPLFGIEAKNLEAEVFIPGGINDMVANDDLLMITGNEEVILFNGERWFNLFDKNRTEEELRATGTFYDPREL